MVRIDSERYDFHTPERYAYRSKKGLDEDVVREISSMKKEPEWMLQKRLEAYAHFRNAQMPGFGPDLSPLDFSDLYYYVRPSVKKEQSWDKVPEEIKMTFDRLGIPETERKFLAGSTAQFESEAVYHHLKKQWEEKGIIFTDMDSGLREYPEIVRKHFGTVVPLNDNKFASLNSAVWSGGSFVYVPKGVKCEIPLQAYYRINTEKMGQFERTLIIADEGSSVHFVEGCSAPVYSAASLHTAVVEIIAKKNSDVRYTTIQNWSNNVYNLVTKRAIAHENARVEWLDGNIGSKVTMKYPCIVLSGEGARGEVLSVAFAGKGQSMDAGAKMIHLAPNTTSRIMSKSISQGGGRSSYRGLVRVKKGATGCKSFVQCDAYILDSLSRSDTYPSIRSDEDSATIGHEAKVGRVGQDKLFYLMSRGISEKDALAMIVLGFIDSFTKQLPMEYAVELNRLIEMQLGEAVA